MLASVQAMFLMALRLTRLHEEGRLSHEAAALVKAWNTARGREVVALGRELLGGNGILAEFGVAKVPRGEGAVDACGSRGAGASRALAFSWDGLAAPARSPGLHG
jgi:alkylation response protein AidB-like acyl-CoA dehydrogenase